MTNSQRDELLQCLRMLRDESPELRFGQLIANLAVVARGAEESAVWDMEDDELLAAAHRQLSLTRERHAQVA